MSIETCFLITKSLVAVWAILSAAEWLSTIELFNDTGLLSWKVLKLRSNPLFRTRITEHFSSARAVRLVLIARIVASGCVIAVGTPSASAIFLFIVLLSCFYLSYRTCFGGDGSDQMGFITAFGALMMALGLTDSDLNIVNAGILLIGGQATLSYFVAGVSKLSSPIWRRGDAIMGVMNTQTYGHPLAVGLAADKPRLCVFICWLVIVTEILFPLVLVAPTPIMIFCLLGFSIFHLSNAYFMGLNAFVWPFIATYPSVIVLNSAIQRWVFL